MIKAVIFDMDGTLLDSMHVWDHVGEQYLASLHIQAHHGLQEILTPMSIAQSAAYLKETYPISATLEAIKEGFEQCVLYQYQKNIQLKEGVKACLQRCKEKGLRLCVLSASSKQMIESACIRCGIYDAFEYIMTCDEAGYPKTDARIYEKIVDVLGLSKQECLFIDDAYYAISCMKEAGYKVYGVYDKANHKDWETIRRISDQSFISLKDWEV